MSAIQQFHSKLHRQPIQLENIKSVYSQWLDEWRDIRATASPVDDSLVKEVDEMFRKVFKNFVEYSPLAKGKVVADETDFPFRQVKSWITLDEFKSLPRGFGGRVGVVFYTADKYVCNISNWNLVSDFGGGLKAKNTPYQGLYYKIQEECPKWSRYIFNRLPSEETKIYCIETFHLYNQELTKKEMRFQFLIFIRFDMKLLNCFQATEKVKKIMLVPHHKLDEVISAGRANPGLVQLAKVNVQGFSEFQIRE